ncbi:MAG: NAD(P)-dependent alcohol dehydrogenase [Bdellovibrio sp.]|nr:NAD(P)-dependent alcohol dehydrogenase [Bdellovibrio sp.]
MKAVRFVGVGKPAQVTELPTREPKAGEVLVKIGGAGVCHSDLHVLHQGIGIDKPFTLGHENAGWVASVGSGVTFWKEGDPVAIYGPWGCGHCHACMQSMENYCENWVPGKSFGGGLGSDGGMANYMIVPSERLLVPLGKLDPKDAAPLSDAALTPYHGIKRALPYLTPDATAVVLGVGGLGHMAVQLLKVLSGCRIVAADVDNSKLEMAKKLGADLVVNTKNIDEAAEMINKFTGPRKASLVLDCVGVQPTVDLGTKIVGQNSAFTILGLGGGVLKFAGNTTLPFACSVSMPYWGSRAELMEVLKLAETGRIHAEVTHFKLDETPDVYKKLEEGKIKGRAVIVPN